MIFPPAFMDSSSWNDNQQYAHHQVAAGGGGDGNHELPQPSIMPGGLPQGGGGPVGPAKPMSMAERARLARIPAREPGLKCPRCESTDTKFCYFNNYSLSQPRHFCRACRRYWTRGGELRNVPVGSVYRRHAKRVKPKVSSAAAASWAPAAAATSGPAGSTTSSACATVNAPALPAMLSSGLSILPPLLRLADLDDMSVTGMGKLSVDAAGCYSVGGGSGGGAAAGLEKWRVLQQMQHFPFLHAMDQAAMAPAAPSMAMTGMFHLGVDGDIGRGGGGNGNGEDGGELHVMPSKREGYPRGMDGDQLTGYTSYSNTTTGNHLL